MHHNEAYGYSDPAQLSVAPGNHGNKIEMKRVTSVSSDQMNVAGSTSHIEMESEYYCIDAPVSSKSHQVASEYKARTRSFAGEGYLAGSQMKLQKRFSMDYNKLKHHTGTQPLDAIHSTLEQGTTNMEHDTTSSLEQEMESKVATSPLVQSARKSLAEYSQLSLPLRKGRCDASQQMQHNQEQLCHEEAPTSLAIEEPGSIEQEKNISIPKVLVDQEPNGDSNPPLQRSKLIA